ncbi:MAG: TPM domain-containing protein, partial [Calditrichaeota bacterium]
MKKTAYHFLSINALSRFPRGIFAFILINALLLSGAIYARSGQSPQFPKPVGFVNDFAGVIPPEYRMKIQQICEEVKQKTGAEIAVATVKTVGDMDYTEYSIRLFETWRIGEKGKDNGVMLFLTMKERRVRIEVGYGLEGIIPDITAGRILDQLVVPEFRRGNYGAGMLKGVQAVAQLIGRANNVQITGIPANLTRRVTRKRHRSRPSSLLYLLLFFFILPALFSRGRRRGYR